ncbi:PspA/IM30 family protein [Methylobacterium sp. C25]|uniref:PspA/IM30 family protein n=1 Tax=Methylobacterium sp. C25 TaxID=2721622 RepID=UPI001F211EB1|nr:PspA/IM30 family protein [Methylobacterium sp. C25]MCE4223511.1 PspA/IM30 family protein [Methylobacterium sp. C25]
MLKLFRILARGAAARAEEELLDRNALLILDQQVRETRASLERSRRALAAAIAADQAEGRKLTEIESRAADLETRTIAALSAGREDLAREAAQAIAELESERDAIRQARSRYEAEVARIRTVVADATRRQAELERGRRTAAAAEAVRRMRVNPGPNELATLTEAEATLNRLRELQLEAADTEAALAEIDPGVDIAERMAREGFGSSSKATADAVLDRLRRRADAA